MCVFVALPAKLWHSVFWSKLNCHGFVLLGLWLLDFASELEGHAADLLSTEWEKEREGERERDRERMLNTDLKASITSATEAVAACQTQ